jgi:hypothetical protein
MEAFNFATSLDLTELSVHVRMYDAWLQHISAY